MAFQKIEKDFVLSDSSLNCYGFRLLTSGYQIAEFLKNPIGYYMHKRDEGVLVRWEDVRIEGDKVLGKPTINMSHPRGAQTVDEINDGFLNAASMGTNIVLDSEESYNEETGEMELVITKWYNKECSLVDQPGNDNALVEDLFDVTGQAIPDLAAFTRLQNNNFNTMKKITLQITPELVEMLNLSDGDHTETAIREGIEDLSRQAKTARKLSKDNRELKDKNEELTTQVADLKAEYVKKEVTELLDSAMDAKKITKQVADLYAKDYADNPKGLKSLLDAMPTYKGIVENLNGDDKVPEQFKDKSWSDLFKSNELPDLMAKHPTLYKELYRKEFGHDPKM